jgi:hypothetical protein
MAGNIHLEVVTPEKLVVSEDVQIVAAPGSLGEFGVLIGHTPFLTALFDTRMQTAKSATYLQAVDLPKRFRIKSPFWPNRPREDAILILGEPKRLRPAPSNAWPKIAQKKMSILDGPKHLWNGRWYGSELPRRGSINWVVCCYRLEFVKSTRATVDKGKPANLVCPFYLIGLNC